MVTLTMIVPIALLLTAASLRIPITRQLVGRRE
jgi:hypothetical protein